MGHPSEDLESVVSEGLELRRQLRAGNKEAGASMYSSTVGEPRDGPDHKEVCSMREKGLGQSPGKHHHLGGP